MIFLQNYIVLCETIRLMGEVDGAIDVHGGWSIRYNCIENWRKDVKCLLTLKNY
jgi:hypothetical protein